jgi:hypothetical protein
MEYLTEIRFTVIGDFDASENIYSHAKNIEYIGALDAKFLSINFQKMHIIISPARSHVVHYGSFDGFPTGAALNAVLNGCALITTDPHDNAEKLGLIDGEDLLLTSDRASEVEKLVLLLFNDRKLLYKIALNGFKKFSQISDFDNHKSDKFGLLKKNINNDQRYQ